MRIVFGFLGHSLAVLPLESQCLWCVFKCCVAVSNTQNTLIVIHGFNAALCFRREAEDHFGGHKLHAVGHINV